MSNVRVCGGDIAVGIGFVVNQCRRTTNVCVFIVQCVSYVNTTFNEKWNEQTVNRSVKCLCENIKQK